MQQLNLQPIPAQTLTYLDTAANQWEIGVRLTELSLAFTFRLNGVLLLENVTGVAGYKLIPYEYLSPSNFVMVTQGQEILDYTKFGTTQYLIALSAEEIESLKAPIYEIRDRPIVAADFDPRGELPLRFKPQGYVVA
jgi:hypothetical protein